MIWLVLGVGAAPLLVLGVVVAARVPFLAVAAYASIVPFGSAVSVPGIPGAFGTLSTIAGLAAAAAATWHLLRPSTASSRLARPAPVWVLLLALAVLSATWSVDLPTTVRDAAVLLSLVGLYVVVTLLPATARDVRWFELGIVGGGAIAGCIAVWQLLTGTISTETGIPRFTLIGGGGEVGDPNVTAASLLLPLALALPRTFATGPRGHRGAFGVAAALTSVAILLTGSRGALVGIVVVLLVLGWNEPRRRLALGYVLVPAVALLIAFATAPGAIQERLQETGSTGRTEIWRLGVLACPRHCVIGSGWGTYPDVHAAQLIDRADATGRVYGFEAHDILLQALVEVGVAGLLLLTVGLVLTFRDLLPLPPSLRGPPLAGLAGVVVSNLFLSNADFKYFWLVLAYATVVTLRHHRVDATNRPPRGAVQVTRR